MTGRNLLQKGSGNRFRPVGRSAGNRQLSFWETGSGTGSGTGGDPPPVSGPIPDSSIITGGLESLYYVERDPETGSTHPGSLAGERVFASLSPPADQESRDAVPDAPAENPVSGDPDPETDPETGPQENRAPTLRPYQLAAITAIEAEWARGVKRTLLVLPTGTGKTVVFAELIRRFLAELVRRFEQRGDRALVLAHREELLEQAQRKLLDVGVWSALEKAERRARSEPVVVASVQTLQRKRLERFRPEEFGVVIVDEAHHSTATSYRRPLDRFRTAFVLGVTATPDRADGTALGEMFESVAYRYELRDAIRDGYLVPITARRIFVESVDLSAIKTRAGDLAQDELAQVMASDQAILEVVIPLLEQAGDRRTIVFGVDVAHSMALTQAICERRPGAARVAHGEMDRRARAELLGDFRAGQFQFLVNCALFTEGFDEPSLACVACARPTKSRALYTQMVGRGTRLARGKRDLLVLDFVGNAGRHKLVGPLDALAPGDVDEAVRREAERMLAEEVQDLDGLVDEAAAALERRREEARRGANAHYFARDIDPFFGDQLGEPYDGDWAIEPATLEERQELIELGLKRIPAGLTSGEARRILEADRKRRKLGLCSYKQHALLARVGIEARDMTKARASARIGIIAQCDWDMGRAWPRLRQLEASELIAKNTAEHRAINRGERA